MKADTSKIIAKIKKELPRLKQEYNVTRLDLFGSFVKSEQKENSDLDLLVTFNQTPSLIQFVKLKNQLSDLLGIQVDLVMKKSLKPRIGKNILREAVPL